jgi:hypothetical protein
MKLAIDNHLRIQDRIAYTRFLRPAFQFPINQFIESPGHPYNPRVNLFGLAELGDNVIGSFWEPANAIGIGIALPFAPRSITTHPGKLRPGARSMTIEFVVKPT